MKIRRLHTWDLAPREAIALQRRLAPRVRLVRPARKRWERVAGADVAISKRTGTLVAGVVVVQLPQMEVIEEVLVTGEIRFPYVPGLLSFREAPVLIRAFERVKHAPQAVICDGQGIAHPRRLGLATHLGLWLDVPTAGSAKSRLIGEHSAALGRQKGSRVPLRLAGRTVGVVLRTRDGVKPLYVSPGHRMDVDSAAELVLGCCTRYRCPEPQRLADRLVGRRRREIESSRTAST